MTGHYTNLHSAELHSIETHYRFIADDLGFVLYSERDLYDVAGSEDFRFPAHRDAEAPPQNGVHLVVLVLMRGKYVAGG